MKIKTKLLALLLVFVMLFCTSCDIQGIIGQITGGGKTPPAHTCESVCETCGGCTDAACTETACATKCAGHEDDGKHTVTFVTNGATAIAPMKVEDGKRLNSLPNPKRDGYTFLGWFTDEACTVKWNNITKVTDDVTLYAGWKKNYVFDRDANSTSPAEILTWYTATPEDFEAAKATVERMKEAGMNDIDSFEALYDEFETVFYHLAEQMTVASIIYYCDMSNEEAQDRHLNINDMFRDLQNAYNVALQDLLENSPHSDELFEGWTEEEKQSLRDYRPEIMELRSQVDALEVLYNDLDDRSSSYGEKVAEYYRQMIVLNNQIAVMNGYNNYYDYATKEIYGRDYSAEDLNKFHGYVRSNISSKIDGLIKAWRNVKLGSNEDLYNAFMERDFDSMDDNYVMMYFDSLGDTNMGVAMRDVFENENCVFTNSGNPHPTAFQTWLYETEKPFCLFGGQKSSTTVIHEVGHYYAAYINDDIDDYDLCETHSQGNEFLFMDFCSDKLPKNVFKSAIMYQLINTCGTITFASIVDQFEQAVYSLPNETVANMTDKDLLLSISNLMDKKLQPIQNQLVAVEERLNTKVERLQGELKSIQGDVHQINIHLECNIEPRLQNIENCYLSTFERYKDSTEKIESMEMDVSVMKDVILEHSRQLKMIS
jgi:uncharacterized repeat protein (TIGR02543 family)